MKPAGMAAHRWGCSVQRIESVASNAQLDANARRTVPVITCSCAPATGPTTSASATTMPASQASDNNSTDVMCGHDRLSVFLSCELSSVWPGWSPEPPGRWPVTSAGRHTRVRRRRSRCSGIPSADRSSRSGSRTCRCFPRRTRTRRLSGSSCSSSQAPLKVVDVLSTRTVSHRSSGAVLNERAVVLV